MKEIINGKLSVRAINFLKQQEKREELYINKEDIEKHLSSYPIKSFSEILRFQESFSGIVIQGVTMNIFTPKQIKENKSVNTFHCGEKILWAINDTFYISENGEIAIRDYNSHSLDFFFYYEFFETFIEQQAFFKEYQYYKNFPAISYNVTGEISLLSHYFSDFDFIAECSDKYHYLWKDDVNLIHAKLYPEGWSIIFDSVLEFERYDLIDKLKSKNLIE